MAQNECIPFYDDGDNISGFCEAAVTGKTFVQLGASRTGPDFDPNATSLPDDRGSVHIVTADGTGTVFGVAAYDGAAGAHIDVIRGSKMVVPVTAGAALTVGEAVGPDGTGKAIGGGTAGYVIADCAAGADAQVSLN